LYLIKSIATLGRLELLSEKENFSEPNTWRNMTAKQAGLGVGSEAVTPLDFQTWYKYCK